MLVIGQTRISLDLFSRIETLYMTLYYKNYGLSLSLLLYQMIMWKTKQNKNKNKIILQYLITSLLYISSLKQIFMCLFICF